MKYNKQPKTFDEVIQLLKGERDYQDIRWKGDGDDVLPHQHSPEEWIMYMEDYLDEAKHILSREDEIEAYPKALEIIRKVTAMGVACIEQNGCLSRR